MGVTGTEDELVKAQLKRFKRLRITVRIGELFQVSPLDRRNREAALQKSTDEIMCHIAALLPEAYRGVYADHPRLLEYLHESSA